ncbi:hypothetical protein B0O99DRAFT_516569 [Bisporella sp. PMI_857]|nr:hypothetical protein B0O99DRAFT_516569 [Bisporella sp. PMI_857]
MCRQILKISQCGHNNGDELEKCEKPTKDCGGIFLKPVLKSMEGLCTSCQKARDTQRRRKEADDEGYWS